MGQYQVSVSEEVDAAADRVYKVIADYHEGHQAILPRRYFERMEVLEGGYGAGTVIAIDMNVYGAKAHMKMTVSEPQPGRVLQEEDPDAGIVTTFTVEELGPEQSRVTIATRARTAAGLRGLLERCFNPPITRRIYREELGQLKQVVNR